MKTIIMNVVQYVRTKLIFKILTIVWLWLSIGFYSCMYIDRNFEEKNVPGLTNKTVIAMSILAPVPVITVGLIFTHKHLRSLPNWFNKRTFR